MIKRSHSSFWLGDRGFSRLNSVQSDPIELAKYQRSISKFVKILTKESIPVTFHSDDNGDSYTDGKSVTISSEINQKNFDSIVGLALHEGSHIQLTDFETLKQKETYLYNSVRRVLGYSDSSMVDEILQNWSTFKSILNYVEDRRIDYYVYTNSPGYKPYYGAMYERYFNDKVIDKAIASNEYTELNLQSYMFRIINFLNKNRRLDALPQLDEIHSLIFDNVPSIESTSDSMDITLKIYRIIKDNIDVMESEEQDSDSGNSNEQSQSNDSEESSSQSSQPSNSDSNESSQSGGSESSDDDDEGSESSSGGSEESDEDEDEDENSSSGSDESDSEEENDSEGSEGSDGSDESENELSDSEKMHVDAQIQKQTEFLDGNVDKESVSETTKKMVDDISKMDIESENISYQSEYGGNTSVDVALIRGFTDRAFEVFPRFASRKRSVDRETYGDTGLTQEVQDGINLGKRLGKKLQIRNRERTTTFNRRKKGKLDKRRIHALGHGDSTVFNQYVTEQHADAFLHISIDGSGSMNSNGKFANSIKSAVAMAQMASMTNIDIEISIRYTSEIGGKNYPIIWVVYDSRKDTMKTITKYFKYLTTMGLTPEGLCFEKIMEQLPFGSDSLKTYFINYSDGIPNYSGYGDEPALKHTASQVKQLKKRGYTVLSFFLSDSYGSGSSKSDFETMYGKDSSFIDPTNLTDLVKTLQKTFMSR